MILLDSLSYYAKFIKLAVYIYYIFGIRRWLATVIKNDFCCVIFFRFFIYRKWKITKYIIIPYYCLLVMEKWNLWSNVNVIYLTFRTTSICDRRVHFIKPHRLKWLRHVTRIELRERRRKLLKPKCSTLRGNQDQDELMNCINIWKTLCKILEKNSKWRRCLEVSLAGNHSLQRALSPKEADVFSQTEFFYVT